MSAKKNIMKNKNIIKYILCLSNILFLISCNKNNNSDMLFAEIHLGMSDTEFNGNLSRLKLIREAYPIYEFEHNNLTEYFLEYNILDYKYRFRTDFIDNKLYKIKGSFFYDLNKQYDINEGYLCGSSNSLNSESTDIEKILKILTKKYGPYKKSIFNHNNKDESSQIDGDKYCVINYVWEKTKYNIRLKHTTSEKHDVTLEYVLNDKMIDHLIKNKAKEQEKKNIL